MKRARNDYRSSPILSPIRVVMLHRHPRVSGSNGDKSLSISYKGFHRCRERQNARLPHEIKSNGIYERRERKPSSSYSGTLLGRCQTCCLVDRCVVGFCGKRPAEMRFRPVLRFIFSLQNKHISVLATPQTQCRRRTCIRFPSRSQAYASLEAPISASRQWRQQRTLALASSNIE